MLNLDFYSSCCTEFVDFSIVYLGKAYINFRVRLQKQRSSFENLLQG